MHSSLRLSGGDSSPGIGSSGRDCVTANDRPERWYKGAMHIPILEQEREVSHLEVEVAERATRPGGEGAVLYLHGFGSSQGGEKARFFRSRVTAAGLDFWSLDFQGHGGSGGGMRELTLSRCLADVELARGAMTEHGVDRVIVIGSSMGALAGLWHTVLRPEGVTAGLYIAPALGLERAFREWAGDDGVARWERDGVVEVSNELGTWQLGWEFVEDLRRYPHARLAAELRTPSLLLQGKRDDRVDWRDVVALAADCAGDGVELHLFADGDHRLVDRKEHLWRLMHGFLEARGVLT